MEIQSRTELPYLRLAAKVWEGLWCFFFFFLLKLLGDISPSRGATDTFFWISGDVCPGFQSQGESLACVLPRLRTTVYVTKINCLFLPAIGGYGGCQGPTFAFQGYFCYFLLL